MRKDRSAVTRCRICGNSRLETLIDLGRQRLSGVFPARSAPDPSLSPLELIKCGETAGRGTCGLVQLRHNASLREMYGSTYGYHSSLSPTMVSHLKGKVSDLLRRVDPQPGDAVLDIGCNDGTLLNFYAPRKLFRVGMDPSSRKFLSNFQKDIKVICDFFSAEKAAAAAGGRQFRIITSIAMFYDLDDPMAFMRQIRSLLARDGVWALELAYLPLMLTNLTYDQICHEHLTYLGLRQIKWMMDRTGLKLLDVSLNFSNGGSFHILAGRDDTRLKPRAETIARLLAAEEALKRPEPYERFRNRVLSHRDEIRSFLDLCKAAGKRVYGYGASTKGNIVLNWCGVGPQDLVAICDKNSEKHGLATPGTRIPIISQEEMRRAKPDVLLVFIWHFRREVIDGEKAFLARGGRLAFDLPRLHLVDRANAARCRDASFEDLAYLL